MARKKYRIELSRYVNDEACTVSWHLYVWENKFWNPKIAGSKFYYQYKPSVAEVEADTKALIEEWENREPEVKEGSFYA